VKQHIIWKTEKLFKKQSKMNGEKNIDEFTDAELVKEDICNKVYGDFDIKGKYLPLNSGEIALRNQSIHLDDWYTNKAKPFQKKVIDLKREGLKDQDIASQLKAPITQVYNVLKNNKNKFKDLEF